MLYIDVSLLFIAIQQNYSHSSILLYYTYIDTHLYIDIFVFSLKSNKFVWCN